MKIWNVFIWNMGTLTVLEFVEVSEVEENYFKIAFFFKDFRASSSWQTFKPKPKHNVTGTMQEVCTE